MTKRAARRIALLVIAGAALLAAHPSTTVQGFLSGIDGSTVFTVAPEPAERAADQEPAPPPATETQSQEPPPVTFRVEVNYVEVDAIVTDADGNPVTDLTIEDFEVLEDGAPQTVTTFSLVNLPVERAERPLFATAPIELDVQTNTTAEGRIYVIVLDDWHIAPDRTLIVKDALREFLERDFGVNDLGAVVYTSGRAADGQDFTNNPRLLLASVDKLTGRKLRSETLEIADLLNRPSRNPNAPFPTDPLELERSLHARSTMDAIRQLADFMAGVRGRRKAMILVSEGVEYNVFDPINNVSATIVQEETRDAVAAATRANVAIYAIDPRGLSAFVDTIEVAGTPGDDANREFSAVRSLQATLLLAQESLRYVSAETGGFAALNRNEFGDAFTRIVRENSTYYVLGYYPTNERRDGRFRRLQVRVNRPGVQVRFRNGYTAPRGRAEPPEVVAAASPLTAAVNDAVASPIPLGGLAMHVFAAAYKGEAPNASVVVAIEVAGDAFSFAEVEGTFRDRLEVTFTAVDTQGETRGGDRHVIVMNMKPDTVTRVRERGFRVVSKTDVPPGRYQLRVGAAEEGATRAGSVLYDIDVPDFYAPPFAMSGVSLTSAVAQGTLTVRPHDPLGDFLPGPPTAAREFQQDDVLALFAEFYENVPDAPPHSVDLTTTMQAEDGRVVFENREERSSTDLLGASGGHGYALQIPLSGFAAGTYLIHVEGRSRVSGPEAGASRDVVIRIR